jgi:hypothetical protein
VLQVFLTPWPATLFAAFLAFMIAFAVSGIVVRAGSGVAVRILALLVSMAAAAGAAWAFGFALMAVVPGLFPPAYAIDRAITTVPFAFLGAAAGISYAEGYRLSALWR